jgi:hypothetical protein
MRRTLMIATGDTSSGEKNLRMTVLKASPGCRLPFARQTNASAT